jgi:two-component system CheB/CheR fusion protein
VFDAFEQGGARMTRQFGGLGLGLAIAKAVVEMHGGTIRAASDGVGHGATFSVELQTAAARKTAALPAAIDGQPRETPLQATRVLLAEDHPDTARTMARLLATMGFEVKAACSVAAALELAAGERFDVMVSDIGLPDGTGYELMEQIRQRHGIKGIALSGYGMEEDVRRSREAGFSEHMVKPINVMSLEAVLRRVVG